MLSSSAEPSQQVCRLQSAHLLTIVTTPYCCTITHLIVVQPYTLQLYNFTPHSCTTLYTIVVQLQTLMQRYYFLLEIQLLSATFYRKK